MKFLHRYLYHHRSKSGFTLTELLVAVSLTGAIAMLAGFGLVAIMQAQKKASSEISQRTNLNRALDFIADDIRMAKTVSTNVSSGELPATLSCGSSSTITGILKLTMPNESKVVYYLNNINSATNCAAWILKPAAVYRCTVAANASQCSDAGMVLVDAIMTNSNSPSCSSSTDTSGFYASISNNRSVDLCLRGRMTTAYGNSSTTPYAVRSQVSARAF